MTDGPGRKYDRGLFLIHSKYRTLSWCHEIGAENGLEGDSIFPTNSVPVHKLIEEDFEKCKSR